MGKALFGESKEAAPNRYAQKMNVPQYTPSKVCPTLDALCDTTKYGRLVKAINGSNVSEDEKKFLRLAATRHIVFNYSKVADYYANASDEMQDLMEQSALVIIDIDDAIANGYVKLSKHLEQLLAGKGDNRRINHGKK